MSLAPGLKLGPYELTGLLGAGGMGEVWRARDPRLGRDVAIKVLPEILSRDPERLARFKREAQILAALSHPHVGAIYGLEEQDGVIALVLELVEGPTLEDRIGQGPIPLDEALPIAVQVASGLEAAHERGIVHRDLKPANVKLTAEGQAKVLDFGLAKASPSDSSSAPRTHAATVTTGATEAGAVMGTAAYMSPEQARGKAADRRTDVWAFGALLYEMLTGHRAFPGETASDAMAAILRGEADLAALPPTAPPAIRALVRRCLIKDPMHRLQAIGDARIVIEEVLEGKDRDGMLPPPAPARSARPSLPLLAALVALALALGGAAGWALRRPAPAPLPTYTQLTFERGRIQHARFAPEGGVVYSAVWGNRPAEIYTTSKDSPVSRPLGIPGTTLAGVSRTGELAILRDSRRVAHFLHEGMLARVPFGGGAPRDLLDRVEEADWDPVGGDLAVVRPMGDVVRLEFPPGKVLYETTGWITNPRFSPDGSTIAFCDHPIVRYDDQGHLAVVGRDGGTVTSLTPDEYTIEGVAWRPDGKEIWYTSGPQVRSLKAVTLDGTIRELASFPMDLALRDVAPDGRILVSTETTRRSVLLLGEDGAPDKDVSYLDQSTGADLSEDGRTLLIVEESAAGKDTLVAIRRLSDPAAVNLGEGGAMALTPDARWVLVSRRNTPRLWLYPTGAGTARELSNTAVPDGAGGFTPDGRTAVFSGRAAGRPRRLWALPLDGGPERPVTPETFTAPSNNSTVVVSPDGGRVLASDEAGTLHACPFGATDPAACRPVPGVEPGETAVQWAADGRTIYVAHMRRDSVRVYRVDLVTGSRALAREIVPPDPGGVEFYAVFVTRDARHWAYTYKRLTSDLYLVEGVR